MMVNNTQTEKTKRKENPEDIKPYLQWKKKIKRYNKFLIRNHTSKKAKD